MRLHGVYVQQYEVARLLGVHRNTVRKMERENRLPPIIHDYCRVVGELQALVDSTTLGKNRRNRKK
jgi:DNA-binding XRE family transcriptional regulator